jgi:cell division transport system permease protein
VSKAPGQIPEQLNPRLPGGYNLPPFGIHQFLALIIVCISLWALGVMWLAMQAADQWVGSWQQDIHLHVYLDSAKSGKAHELSKSLVALPDVASVRKISADEAATWMRSWLKNVGLEQKELAHRLPMSFELTLNKTESDFMFSDIRDVAERFGAQVNEEEVNLAQVHQWLSQLSYVAWFASLILALAMALIISNTLRMTLLARADEIHLMRLLGAREWFVRMPFILEGMLLGAGAGVLAWLLLWPLVWATGEWFAVLQVDLSIWGLLLPLLFGGGLVGGLGAVIATAHVVSSQSSS